MRLNFIFQGIGQKPYTKFLVMMLRGLISTEIELVRRSKSFLGHDFEKAEMFSSSMMPETDFSTILDLCGCLQDNYGFNGEVSADMAKRLPNYLQIAENEKNPYRMMLLLGGTNDLEDYTSDSILNNLMKMHRLAEEKGIYSVAMTLPRNRPFLS